MEYLNFEKSGLITILIPLNFLIGEYTLFFRLRGWNRKIIHFVIAVISLINVAVLILSGENPYYPFSIFGGMLIGIVQSEWNYRKVDKLTVLDKIEVMLKAGRALMGVIVLFIVLAVRLLYPQMFLGLPLIERIFSYFVLNVWAFEMIVFNIVLITKYHFTTFS